MKKGFHKLPVAEIKKETFDTVSIKVDVPADLAESFTYLPGQYLTFETEINGQAVRRSYSLCSSPDEGEWRVAIKKVTGGVFSSHANEALKVGDSLDVMLPMGNFYPKLDAAQQKHYVLFAAGSGITPVFSILKAVLKEEPLSRVTLFYGNKTGGNIIFKEALEGIKNKNLGRFALHYFLSRERMDAELFQGRLNKEKCGQLLNCFPDLAQADHFFICGPFEMIEDVKNSLTEAGVPAARIHFELFSTPGQEIKKKKETLETGETSAASSKVTVKVDGLSFDFDLGFHGDNILDAAIARGADLPYSCKGGVCSTCRAKLVEGEVEMAVNYALEEDEIEDGYILTCQAHPRTEAITVDFDQ